MSGTIEIQVRRGEPSASGASVAVDLAMPSDVDQVESAVELMARQCFADRTPCARTAFRLRVTLAEAISNAILRGNCEDPTKRVTVTAELSSDAIRLCVSDEGMGVAPALRANPSLPAELEQDGGRGLFIIKHLADRVEFNDRGNTIWMTLPRF